MHPRLSISQVSSWDWTLEEDLEFYEEAGITAVGISARKLKLSGEPLAAAQRVVDAGLQVTNLIAENPFVLEDRTNWIDQTYELGEVIDIAKVLRPEAVVIPAGGGGSMAWERAADSLEQALHGTLQEAHREGIWFILEFTNPLRTDISFVHSLRDAIDLGWRLDMGVCMEITACWYERNLVGTIHSGVAGIGLVQLSDYAIGTHDTPNRLVPGDGDIPFKRILRQLLDAGYEGMFDLELRGPKIDEEGYASAINRSIEYLDALFDELDIGPPLGPVGALPVPEEEAGELEDGTDERKRPDGETEESGDEDEDELTA